MGQDNHMVTYPIERNFFGLKIFFCSGPPESQDCRPDAVLEASAIRSATAKNALREALQNALGAPPWSESLIGLPSLRGEWFRAAGVLKELGVRQLIVSTPAHLNERMSAIRSCIPVWSKKTVFLPTRKCAYSSIREYCLQNFSECQKLDHEKR